MSLVPWAPPRGKSCLVPQALPHDDPCLWCCGPCLFLGAPHRQNDPEAKEQTGPVVSLLWRAGSLRSVVQQAGRKRGPASSSVQSELGASLSSCPALRCPSQPLHPVAITGSCPAWLVVSLSLGLSACSQVPRTSVGLSQGLAPCASLAVIPSLAVPWPIHCCFACTPCPHGQALLAFPPPPPPCSSLVTLVAFLSAPCRASLVPLGALGWRGAWLLEPAIWLWCFYGSWCGASRLASESWLGPHSNSCAFLLLPPGIITPFVPGGSGAA